MARTRVPKIPPGTLCAVEGCDRPCKSRDLCNTHYVRFRRTGDAGPAGLLRAHWNVHETCTLEGCARPHYSGGWCNMHWQRVYRHGDVGGPEPKLAARGSGTTNHYGYRQVYVDGRLVNEHRVIMEKHIGRPLLRSETVHHRNGVRDDNRIENLQLRSGNHPRGATVKDHLDWAWQIVERYGMLADDIVAS